MPLSVHAIIHSTYTLETIDNQCKYKQFVQVTDILPLNLRVEENYSYRVLFRYLFFLTYY